MPNYFQNVDFSRDSLNIRLIFDFIFFKNLDGNFFACNEMSSQTNFTKCTLPK
jgi:hypothetical protein